MNQTNTNRVHPHPTGNLQAILRRHEFVSLPTRDEGTHLAIRTYGVQGVVCCDILVYRKINRMGKALLNEVINLNHALSDLQTQFPTNPHLLNSAFQSHLISFLGKRAHVLTDESGAPIYCQIVPVLIYHTETYVPSIRERARAYPAQLIHLSHFEEFLTQKISKRSYQLDNSNNAVQYLRKSYRNLGITLILLPLLFGLSGVLIGLELLSIGLITILVSILGLAVLLQKATKYFKQFKILNTIPVLTTEQTQILASHTKQTEIPSELTSILELLQSLPTWANVNYENGEIE